MTAPRISVVGEPAIVLSQRQAEVLRAAADGLGVKATANSLGIGAESVKSYRETVRKKLGARSITQAAVMAAKAGVL